MKTLVQTFFKLRYFTLAILLLIAFLACSNDDEPEETKNLPIRLSTTGDATKAASIGKQLPAEQQIGVFFAENLTIDPASGKMYEPNLKYTADGNGGLSGTIQYFPGNKNGVKISAYHPYIDNSADEYTFSVNPDQTTNTNVYNSDLLYCPEFAQAKTEGTVTIKLNHKLSQIVFDLAAGDNNPDLTDAQITLLNVNTSVTFNRRTGAISNPSNQQDVKLNNDGNGGIVIPQTLPAGTRFAKIRLKNGKEMFYTTTTALTLVGNKKHTVKLKVNKTETIGIGTEVGEWGDGGTTGGEAGEDTSKKLLPVEIEDHNLTGGGYIKHIYTYDSRNRVATYDYQLIGNVCEGDLAHSSIFSSFIYDGQGRIMQEDETTSNILNGDTVGKPQYTKRRYDYSTSGEILETSFDYSYTPPKETTETIYVDSPMGKLTKRTSKRLRNGEIVITTTPCYYDENGNYGPAYYRYDNKLNPYTYVNLPRWYLQDWDMPIKWVSGKNNLIEEIGRKVYTMQYNDSDFPTRVEHTILINGNEKTRYVTFKYKKWNE